MIYVKVRRGQSIDKALGVLKKKVKETKLMLELREREFYTKPSVIKKENNEISWNGLNFLHYAASRVGALDLEFYSNDINFNLDSLYMLSKKKQLDLVYLLGVDKVDVKKLANSFVIYQGHHGDFGAEYSDIVLPGSTFSEKNGTYINTEGRMQTTYKACNSPGESKEDWKIFRALSDYFSRKLQFNNLIELRTEIIKKFPFFKEINILPPHNDINFGSVKKIENRIFDYNIKNFYMNDSISRTSPTMAECTKEILNKVNYKGYISLEFEGKEDANTGVPKSIELLKRSFNT